MGHVICGILFIVGGLSGHLVLIGTNSSEALALVGAGMVVWGLLGLAKGGSGEPQKS
jgi:hypothetical protein